MTAVLEKLRRFDAARRRGDISDSEFAEIRAALENSIEEATVVSTTAPPPPVQKDGEVWHMVIVMVLIFVMGTALATLIVGDLTLALTLAATLLAAFTVHAFTKMKE